MILEQFYLDCLSHASYLIADGSSGTAAVVDPQRDIDLYAAQAAERNLRIEHVLLTHCHADFLAGHLELRERFGARIHMGAKAEAEFDFEPMADGGELKLGDKVSLRFLETPGHTPEGVTILVHDAEKEGDAPHAALTGDTLFIGDVGRPDLMASVGITARELGSQLYRSLREKILKLPDETLVYPAHGAGSMCGKNLSSETVSTIGDQRRLNYALQPMSEEEFVKLVTADQPMQPAYFAYDAGLNRKERSTLDEVLKQSLTPLSLDQATAAAESGATILDARNADDFARSHLKGSMNIGLDGKYATWAGTLIESDRTIVLVAPPGKEGEAAMRLGRIGFDKIAGYLKGGIAAAEARPDLLGGWSRMTPSRLAEALASETPPLVLDVRGAGERATASIEGSLHVPLNQLAERAGEIPKGRKLAIYCSGGYRSCIAASMLEGRGFEDLTDLTGGFTAWQESRQAKA